MLVACSSGPSASDRAACEFARDEIFGQPSSAETAQIKFETLIAKMRLADDERLRRAAAELGRFTLGGAAAVGQQVRAVCEELGIPAG